MSTQGISVSGLRELISAMEDYRRDIKDDSEKALTKAARETTFAMYEGFREQPPRPIKGSITRAAVSRGYRLNTLSRSYLAGYSSALRILGGAKSGYFRIDTGDGAPIASPVVLGKRGRIVRASRKYFRQRGSLLTGADQLAGARTRDRRALTKFLRTADRSESTFENKRTQLRQNLSDTSLPANAKRLNLGALAALRALQIRERAAAGGYLAAQFLTYKKVKGTIAQRSQGIRVLTKNKLLAGEVVFETDNEGNVEKAIIVGRLPGTAAIAARHGIITRALSVAANTFRADMQKYLAARGQRLAA